MDIPWEVWGGVGAVLGGAAYYLRRKAAQTQDPQEAALAALLRVCRHTNRTVRDISERLQGCKMDELDKDRIRRAAEEDDR